ncbi:MAG: type II toxin-antitoxin system VapC family toxin [Gammaproteobacteria bacterium]|nr:type II toxin-antitoxin system VapC family toxin [Gammaproteobacteria bacterium]
MIAIDTNVLLRYLLDDDASQSKKAAAIITAGDKVLITDVVLVETIWTLKGKKYKLDKEAIIIVINALFAELNVIFEDGQTLWRALTDYTKEQPITAGVRGKEVDFPDLLIVNKAQNIANQLKAVFDGVYTFDVALQAISGARKP